MRRTPISVLPVLPSTDCSDCQYRALGMFGNSSPDAIADFNAIGQLFSLPTGITLNQEDVAGDRVLIICSGQVKLSCVSVGSRTLSLKGASPGDVQDRSAETLGCHFEVTAVTAETLAPTCVCMIRRSEFLAFLGRHGEASTTAAKSLAEVQICFLGCAKAGSIRICSWSSCQTSSWLGTVNAPMQVASA